MKPIVYAVFAALLLAAAPAAVQRQETVRSSEPSGPIDMYAKTLEIRGQGSAATVTIELTVLPYREIEGAVIRGALRDGTGFDRAFGIPDRLETLRNRVVRKIQYSIDLESGKDHDLLFSVMGEGPEGPVTASAYLRVNLDPARRPEDLGNVLQYRAVMQGVSQ